MRSFYVLKRGYQLLKSQFQCSRRQLIFFSNRCILEKIKHFLKSIFSLLYRNSYILHLLIGKNYLISPLKYPGTLLLFFGRAEKIISFFLWGGKLFEEVYFNEEIRAPCSFLILFSLSLSQDF